MLVGDNDGVARGVGCGDCWLLLEQSPKQRAEVVENQPASRVLSADGGEHGLEHREFGRAIVAKIGEGVLGEAINDLLVAPQTRAASRHERAPRRRLLEPTSSTSGSPRARR